MVTKVDQSSDMVGHGKSSPDDPMWKVYIYNQDKNNPKRIAIDMLKSEVSSIIMKNLADPMEVAGRWTDLPKKGNRN